MAACEKCHAAEITSHEDCTAKSPGIKRVNNCKGGWKKNSGVTGDHRLHHVSRLSEKKPPTKQKVNNNQNTGYHNANHTKVKTDTQHQSQHKNAHSVQHSNCKQSKGAAKTTRKWRHRSRGRATRACRQRKRKRATSRRPAGPQCFHQEDEQRKAARRDRRRAMRTTMGRRRH